MADHTGLTTEGKAAVATALGRLLADTYTLYLRTQNYHWNVEGPQFHALHTMFEEQYVEMRDAVDLIAERIRALGHPAPGSYTEFAALTSIEEAGTGATEAHAMVVGLAVGHEIIAETARAAVVIAEDADDVASADLATGRVDTHEKTAWMLRAMAA